MGAAGLHTHRAEHLRPALRGDAHGRLVGGRAGGVEPAAVDDEDAPAADGPDAVGAGPQPGRQVGAESADEHRAATPQGLAEAGVGVGVGAGQVVGRQEAVEQGRGVAPTHEQRAEDDLQIAPAPATPRERVGEPPEQGDQGGEERMTIECGRGGSAANRCLPHRGPLCLWLLQHNNHRPGGHAHWRFLQVGARAGLTVGSEGEVHGVEWHLPWTAYLPNRPITIQKCPILFKGTQPRRLHAPARVECARSWRIPQLLSGASSICAECS